MVRSHGVNFHRTGICKRCGKCEKKSKPCVHLSFQNGLATCDTYGSGDYLEKRCDVFPDNPFCRVVKDGICGFKFIPVSEADEERYKELLSRWQSNI